MAIITSLLIFSVVSFAGATTGKNSSVDWKPLCSNESEKQLDKLLQKGEARFSAYQFDPESVQVSNVEFTDLGETGGRRHHKKKNQVPAQPQYGQMYVMRAMGKEKLGWRNLVVKCGINKGHVATLTYEIHSFSNSAGFTTNPSAVNTASANPVVAPAAAAVVAPSSGSSSSPVDLPRTSAASPGPASVQNP